MERTLPPEYAGWQAHEPELRRMSTPDLVAEVQDGPPDRRLAALSVIDLAGVPPEVVEDWIRTLPDAEANELAGAIPVQRAHASCADDARWVAVARSGFERRRLPTFLVMLLSSLEAMDARGCPEAPAAWDSVGDWLGEMYDRAIAEADGDTVGDLSLFVFENYLSRPSIFEAFCGLIVRNEQLAREVSANPSRYLADLGEEAQRFALQEAAANGGLPFEQSWPNLSRG